MKVIFLKYSIYFFVVFTFLSCKSKALFEEVIDLESGNWEDKREVKLKLDLTNTKKKSHFYLKVRYNNDYSFNNLYIKYALCDSSGKQLIDKLDQLILFDQKTGHPLGSGFAGTFDLEARIVYLSNFDLPYNGKYIFKIRHFMRVNSLVGIKAVGIKVEN